MVLEVEHVTQELEWVLPNKPKLWGKLINPPMVDPIFYDFLSKYENLVASSLFLSNRSATKWREKKLAFFRSSWVLQLDH